MFEASDIWYAKNVKLIGTICVGYPDEKPEKLVFFSNNVLAVRIQAIHYYEKYDCLGQFTSKRFSGVC